MNLYLTINQIPTERKAELKQKLIDTFNVRGDIIDTGDLELILGFYSPMALLQGVDKLTEIADTVCFTRAWPRDKYGDGLKATVSLVTGYYA